MSDLLEKADVETIVDIMPYVEPENPAEHRTHIVNPDGNPHIYRPGMSAQDIVDVARAGGLEVTTLCGFKFVPLMNPERFDACGICMDIAGQIMREVG